MRSIVLLLAGVFSIHAESPVPADPSEAAYPALERFVKVMETVRARHPDLDRVTYERLVNQALDGMLSSLDPHSSFIHPEMRQIVGEDGVLNNEVPSLGLSLGKDSSEVFISAIEPFGPADKAGILINTVVLAINGKQPGDEPLTEVIGLLHGEPGGKIELTLRDHERPGERKAVLTHRHVEERSLIEAKLLAKHPSIGYLRLAQFGATCARETEAALDDLEDKGMKSLIMDLRGNGGGDLHQTVKILGLFVPPETAVVSVRERGKAEDFLKTPDRQRRNRSYPVAVLIDRNSASASELTAAALRDLGRATLIGEKSYGKGSVQNIVPMGSGTALRLTIATYHSPSGETPHLKGVKPAITIPFTEADREAFILAGRSSSLTPQEKQVLGDWMDPAIAAAVDTLGK